MAQQRRSLQHAPVTEAVVDVRVRFSSAPSQSQFDAFGAQIRTSYPKCESQQLTEVVFNIQTGVAQQRIGSNGSLYRSEDGLQVVQAKSEGFSFSRLRPYQSWDATIADARRLWQMYRGVFSPERVIRVSTRFINRLEFPSKDFDFDHYLTIGPRLPEGAPQTVQAFANTVTIPGISDRTLGIVRCQFDPAWATEAHVGIVLDLDIIKECDLLAADDDALWDSVDGLRQVKNVLFFGSLTEKAVEVFE
jgi:uncharacterized protein (TIGR04255 family)